LSHSGLEILGKHCKEVFGDRKVIIPEEGMNMEVIKSG